MLVPRRFHGVSSISAVPLSGTTSRKPKETDPFTKKSKKIYFSCPNVLRQLSRTYCPYRWNRDTVFGQLLAKEKKGAFRSSLACVGWCFKPRPCRMAQMPDLPWWDLCSVVGSAELGSWHPLLAAALGCGAPRGCAKCWANNLHFTAEFMDKKSGIKCCGYTWGQRLSFTEEHIFFLHLKVLGMFVFL